MKEYLLYGTKIDEKRDYMEEVLLISTNPNDKNFEIVKTQAIEKGYNRLHIKGIELNKPEFTKAINI